MTAAILIGVFVASLLGSVHCVGMCGGFVAVYSNESRTPWRMHLSYHLARLVSYASVGAVSGAIGSVFNAAGRSWGVSQAAGTLAALVMVLWGLSIVSAELGLKLPLPRFTRGLGQLARRVLSPRGRPPLHAAAILGLSSTLLPCGFLYAFYVAAAATGAAATGALVMAAFWLGTVPLLLGFGNPRSSGARDQRGLLATRLAGHPFGVLLLDEFEKAHSSVHDAFMQLIDEGRYINGRSETVSVTSMIIIATTNTGAEVYRQSGSASTWARTCSSSTARSTGGCTWPSASSSSTASTAWCTSTRSSAPTSAPSPAASSPRSPSATAW